jgi:hypothetical protein
MMPLTRTPLMRLLGLALAFRYFDLALTLADRAVQQGAIGERAGRRRAARLTSAPPSG